MRKRIYLNEIRRSSSVCVEKCRTQLLPQDRKAFDASNMVEDHSMRTASFHYLFGCNSIRADFLDRFQTDEPDSSAIMVNTASCSRL